jgi:hypothetical protein
MIKRKARWAEEEVNKLSLMLETHGNAAIAKYFKTTQAAVGNALNRRNIKRSPDAIKRLMKIASQKSCATLSKRTGSKNANWKGGISKNNYHYKKIQMERYPERIKARVIVSREIRAGRMIRGNCEICGSSNANAHHDDYSKPLEVRWFCRKDHRYHLHEGKH